MLGLWKKHGWVGHIWTHIQGFLGTVSDEIGASELKFSVHAGLLCCARIDRLR